MKKKVVSLFTAIKGDRLLHLCNKVPRILFYHGVDNRVNPDVEQEIFDIRSFEKQIEYLMKYYEIISIEEFEKRYNQNSFTNKEIVLTFDDKYTNNLYVVAKILNKHKVPFSVFISTEHIATGDFYPTSIARIIIRGARLKKVEIKSQNLSFNLFDKSEVDFASSEISKLIKSLPLKEVRTICKDLISNVSEYEWKDLQNKYRSVRPMNWDEVKELSKYATIGSHCKYHICCHANQEAEEVEKQIVESKQIIEEKINVECNYFVYPNGDFTEESNEIVRKVYRMGFSTKKNERINPVNNDGAIIPRIGVPGEFNKFKIMTNLYPKQ